MVQASNPETPYTDAACETLLFGFILRATMVLRLKVPTSKVLLLVFFGLGVTPVALAQRLPKATGREPANKPASSRRDARNKRPTATVASKLPPQSSQVISSISVTVFASRKNGKPPRRPTKRLSKPGPPTLMPGWNSVFFTSSGTESTTLSKPTASYVHSTHRPPPPCSRK